MRYVLVQLPWTLFANAYRSVNVTNDEMELKRIYKNLFLQKYSGLDYHLLAIAVHLVFRDI